MKTKKFSKVTAVLKSMGKALIMPNDHAGVRNINEILNITIVVLVFVALIPVISIGVSNAADNLSSAGGALLILVPLILVAALLQTFVGKGRGSIGGK